MVEALEDSDEEYDSMDDAHYDHTTEAKEKAEADFVDGDEDQKEESSLE